jgi:hypothetical protein
MTQKAQQAEASNAPLKAVWRDREWTAPAATDWPWDVLEAVDDEKFAHALRGLLSAEDYAAFKALKPTVSDGGELLEALIDGAGIDGTGE